MNRILSLAEEWTPALESLGVEERVVSPPDAIPPVVAGTAIFETARVLAPLAPDLVIAPAGGKTADNESLAAQLTELCGKPVRVHSPNAVTLEQLISALESLGTAVGKAAEGRGIGQRIRAQMSDWADNFYPRMKNKRVSVISAWEGTSGGEPRFKLAGRWIPDLVHQFSAQCQAPRGAPAPILTTWSELHAFRPDVIFVSLEGKGLAECATLFKTLETIPRWEDIPAVKRGEVIFAGGDWGLYRYGPHFLEALGILCSGIAGFESGYITPRDTFHRLRMLELNRHKV